MKILLLFCILSNFYSINAGDWLEASYAIDPQVLVSEMRTNRIFMLIDEATGVDEIPEGMAERKLCHTSVDGKETEGNLRSIEYQSPQENLPGQK